MDYKKKPPVKTILRFLMRSLRALERQRDY